MATNFPTSLDTLTNPTSSDSLSSPSHSAQHANVNDAVEALQAKVGADSSAVSSSLDYKVAQLEAISHGKILQVVSTTKTDTFSSSITAGAEVAVTGLTATITPSSTTSTILVMLDVSGNEVTDNTCHLTVRLKRDGSEVGSGGSDGSRTTAFAAQKSSVQVGGDNVQHVAGTYVDSPATTSATTYSVYIINTRGVTKTYCVNRAAVDGNSIAYTRTSSTITLLEVSA